MSFLETRSNESAGLFLGHLGRHRQYWRDIMLGVNDGLISTFLLIAGVSGGGLSVESILLTSISGSIAGAISMACGEFVATKSQEDVLNGEIALERIHIRDRKEDELRELDILLDKIGFPMNDNNSSDCSSSVFLLREQVKEYYKSSDEALLKIMVALEFGVLDDKRRNALRAAAFSGILFITGSLPSVLLFFIAKDSTTGLIISGISTSKSNIFIAEIILNYIFLHFHFCCRSYWTCRCWWCKNNC